MLCCWSCICAVLPCQQHSGVSWTTTNHYTVESRPVKHRQVFYLYNYWQSLAPIADCLQENGQLQLTLPPSLLSQDQLKHSHTLIAASSDRPSELLTALSLSLASVQTLDLATTQTIYSLSTAAMDDAVHGLVYIPGTAGLLATCSGDRGEVCVWDPREKELGTIFKMNLKTGSESFGFAVSSDAHPHTKLALLCAASGNVLLYDVRQCREPYTMGVLEGINNIRGWFKKTTRIPCIKVNHKYT